VETSDAARLPARPTRRRQFRARYKIIKPYDCDVGARRVLRVRVHHVLPMKHIINIIIKSFSYFMEHWKNASRGTFPEIYNIFVYIPKSYYKTHIFRFYNTVPMPFLTRARYIIANRLDICRGIICLQIVPLH